MAKHFHAEALDEGMIRFTGPGVNTIYKDLNNAQVHGLTHTLDQAYEAGLAGAYATHTLDKAAEAVLGAANVITEPGHYQLEGVNRTGLRINGPGVWWDVSGMVADRVREALIYLGKAYEAGLNHEADQVEAQGPKTDEATNAPAITREVYELRAPAPHDLIYLFLTVNFDDDTVTITPKPWLLPESNERRYPSIGELTDLFAFREEPDPERAHAIAMLIAKAAAFGAERIAAVRKARGQAPAPAPAPAPAS